MDGRCFAQVAKALKRTQGRTCWALVQDAPALTLDTHYIDAARVDAHGPVELCGSRNAYGAHAGGSPLSKGHLATWQKTALWSAHYHFVNINKLLVAKESTVRRVRLDA